MARTRLLGRSLAIVSLAVLGAVVTGCRKCTVDSAAPTLAEAKPTETTPAVTCPIPIDVEMVGTNQAVAEFGKTPGQFGKQYAYPGAKQFDYCKAKGMLIVRLPFKWERIQPEMMKPFDPSELKRLDGTVRLARERGIKLLLDIHNYARRHVNGKTYLIGTPDVPNAAFADLWRRLAERYRGDDGVFAYGLMNEPHDTKGLWPAAAQAAIDAVRTVDMETCIFICGDAYGGAHSWLKVNKDLILKDPANNLVYEAHQYFDRNCSGAYKQSYDDNEAYPDIGVDRLKPFVTWLRQHNLRGFIGEFGVPDDDPRWLVVLDHFVAAMKKEHIGGTYWASGPWWGNYPLSLEPRDGRDRPQMAVMEQYVGLSNEPSDKPWEKAAAEMETGRAERAAARREEVKAAARKTAVTMLFDFAAKKEAYHFNNPDSSYGSSAGEDGGAPCRKFTYKHAGNPAYIGIGLYFGGKSCVGFSRFVLEARSDVKARLTVRASRTEKERYDGSVAVGTDWQRLEIPFEALKKGDLTFASAGELLKLELMPHTATNGNTLYLRKVELAP